MIPSGIAARWRVSNSRYRIAGRGICFSLFVGAMDWRRIVIIAIMVRAPKGFIDRVLWPEFSELDRALKIYLHEVTLRVIREEVYSDTSEAQEVPEALPLN
jgi:tRNA nucleotidyltransferase (CCA-adding enzyme)